MRTGEIQVGSTITNGNGAVRVTARSTGDPGWLGKYISLGGGSLTGVPCLVQESDLQFWRHVPFEWAPIPDARIEERYVWSADLRALEHEVRGVQQ